MIFNFHFPWICGSWKLAQRMLEKYELQLASHEMLHFQPWKKYYVAAFDPVIIRHSNYPKMTVWTSVLYIKLVKVWPEKLVKWPFLSGKFQKLFFHKSEKRGNEKKNAAYVVFFVPIKIRYSILIELNHISKGPHFLTIHSGSLV